jgi:hypothetical protein
LLSAAATARSATTATALTRRSAATATTPLPRCFGVIDGNEEEDREQGQQRDREP